MTIERAALEKRIREIDDKLASLRPRLATLREEVAKLIDKENRHVRLYAEGDSRDKKKIDALLVGVVEQRASMERECKGLAISMAELEASRAELYPQFQTLLEAEQKHARRMRIEELRKQHECAQEAERGADRKLVEARERSNRTFFAWRAALDQEGLDEQAAATERLKNDWARNSGPNARNQRHAS